MVLDAVHYRQFCNQSRPRLQPLPATNKRPDEIQQEEASDPLVPISDQRTELAWLGQACWGGVRLELVGY